MPGEGSGLGLVVDKDAEGAYLLLLQKHGVALVRNTTNVQRVSAVREDLTKVSGVAAKTDASATRHPPNERVLTKANHP